MPHAELKLVIEKNIGEAEDAQSVITCQLSGCHDCITKGLTLMMLKNPKFKEIFNNAARAANVVRQSQQN